MIDSRTGEAPMTLWFGNFYEPQFSDRGFVDQAVAEIRSLGFNSVMLDSKSWQDFFDRYDGQEASQYVATQEYLMERIHQAGMGHQFLAIYLNGDNLYPHIRFSPPVYGESVTTPDGSDGKWYKYWSPKAQELQVAHVSGLLRLYAAGHSGVTAGQTGHNGASGPGSDGEDGPDTRLPICSMWDPIVAPSFDAEGIRRYRAWLKGAYKYDIASLNAAYGSQFIGFDALEPADYWYTLKYGDSLFDADDVATLSPRFRLACDNMAWRVHEFRQYFLAMEKRLHALQPRLRLAPNLTQWNLFLNIDGSQLAGVSFSDLWDTANRGIDPWAVRDCVDDCSFTLVPVTPAGDPEAWVVACQASMIRSLNRGREFTVGFFLGRFLFNDVLRFVPPAELFGSAVAAGASGIFAYGYGGMDDGGILQRMEPAFKESIRRGTAWAKRVIPLTGAKLASPVALLFPSAMARFEPLGISGNAERRLDLLGWYRSSAEAGHQAEIIDLSQIIEGRLTDFRVLVLSANDCYRVAREPAAEKQIRAWVEAGGLLVHGPADQLAEAVFGISGLPHPKDCADYREGLLVQGSVFQSWTAGTTMASWRTSGLPCIVRNSFGQGEVISFGFAYGSSYVSRIAPHVPTSQRNLALYPVNYLADDPWHDLLGTHAPTAAPVIARDVEAAAFANGWVIVNHGSSPCPLSGIRGTFHHQLETGDWLMPHAAVFIQTD